MPNYCYNSLYLKHEDPLMIERIKQAAKKETLFNEFIPVPEDLLNTVSGYLGNTVEQAALVEKQQANIQKYGYPTWYEFCISNWGTKWDCGTVEINEVGDRTHLSFETAWVPPVGFYGKLVELGFTVVGYYYEPGCSFCGMFDDGEDICYDIAEYKSSWISENIPKVIDEEFCIAENIEDNEDEDEDEVLTT